MAEWETQTCDGAPHCRHENGFAEFDGKFYLFGGRRIQPVDVYDPATRTWTQASPPPMEIHHFQPVRVGDELWIAAGSGARGGAPELTRIECLEIA